MTKGVYKDNIVVVGGGSSGWMSAAMLIKAFPDSNITVIESPNHPPIGVGESTYDGIRLFCKYIEIDEKDFFQFTDASIKVGLAFNDFYEKNYGETFIYPFGRAFTDGTRWGLDDWLIKKSIYSDTPVNEFVESYFPQAHLIKYNTFCENIDGSLGGFHPINHTALHFDAIKFGQWLKNRYCLPRNVKNINAEIINITTNDNGIEYLILDSGEKISASLFIDCTGFKAMLIDKTLKEPFISYTDKLPNNRAWATQIPYIDKEKELRAVTTCTAIENGWCWDIPLWSRLGAGYVYSDKYVDPENALQEFKNYLMSDKMAVPRSAEDIDKLIFKDIIMRVGIHERVWVKNVVAIGLSAGFIEPLESNGLFTVHQFLFRLINTLSREKTSQWDISVFNYAVKEIYDIFVEFIQLHYALSIRTDSSYWCQNFDKEYSFSNYTFSNEFSNHTIDLAKAVSFNHKPFPYGGVTWISSGMHYFMIDKVAVSNFSMDDGEWQEYFDLLDRRRKFWDYYATQQPSLYEYLKNKYHNDEVKEIE